MKITFLLCVLGVLWVVSSATCTQKQGHFDLASVRAKDLRKVAEDVRPGVSFKGLNQPLNTVLSPDGKRVAYAEKVGIGAESLLYAIYVSRATGGERIRIAEVVNCFGLAWSPEGSKIVFSEGTIVHIADSNGGTRIAIYVGPGGPYPGASFNLTWSKDGQKLSFIQVENARDMDLANPSRVTITLGSSKEE
jgi:dipeptidyl aminopeptidase/acylaminoacyl peptidase